MPGRNGGEECGILQVSGCAELPVKLPSSERDSAKVPFCLLWVNRARETFIIDRVYILICFKYVTFNHLDGLDSKCFLLCVLEGSLDDIYRTPFPFFLRFGAEIVHGFLKLHTKQVTPHTARNRLRRIVKLLEITKKDTLSSKAVVKFGAPVSNSIRGVHE